MTDRDICLFAHYDPNGRVAEHVLHYLRALRACGFCVYMASSGIEALSAQDAAALAALEVRWHGRPNAGLDFGAWQHLLELGCADDAETILLANDSVFGPMQPLQPIVARMRAANLDVWGFVESHEGSWHLQSWFLCFNRHGLRSPAVQRVLAMPFAAMSKKEIVLHGELGLGAAILSDGLRWGAVWQPSRRGLRRLVPTNPMHVDWLSALQCGVPFLKIELVRDNPARIPWLGRWRSVVESSTSFPSRLIDAHLANGATRHHRPASRRMRLLYLLISLDKRAALASLAGRPVTPAAPPRP